MQSQYLTREPESRPVRIIIAHAQPSFRQILRRQLESEPLMQVVGDASDGRTASQLTRRLRPDILLIECAMNREFSTVCAVTGVIAMIGPSIQDIVEAFEQGARGVVLKASLPAVWGTGIQKILAGQYWIEDKAVALLLEAVRNLLARPDAISLPEFGLTLREIEIAGKIAAGRSNKDVGRDFSICERTVKHHLTNIFKKVGVTSRLELAVVLRDKFALQTRVPPQPEKSVEKPQLYMVAEP